MSWRRAVVIGASGGIGAALARQLRDAGTTVEAFGRSSPDAARRVDLADEERIRAAAELVAGGDPPDLILVASGLLQESGVAVEKSWRDLDPAALARYFAINATGPALVAKHFLPLLPRDRRAGFAALSARVGSISDNRLGGWYGYRASKAALNMMIRTLAIELARSHRQAFCVGLHPGTVDTPLSKPFQGNVPAGQLFTPEISAGHLLSVLAGLDAGDSGACFAWDGARIEP